MTTTTPTRTPTAHAPAGRCRPALAFTAALLASAGRHPKALLLTLGLPVFMLFTLWVPSLTGDEESEELMVIVFPAIILLAAIMPGLTQATRITQWRQQHILERLSLTPVPTGWLVAAAGLSQVVLGLVQGALMVMFGVFVVGLDVRPLAVLAVLTGVVLGSACFVALGSLIGAVTRRSELAGYLFFFTVMPLTFLASFPPDMMPAAVNAVTPWLPTSMALELIGPAFVTGAASGSAGQAVIGLAAATVVFGAASAALVEGRWARRHR